MFFLVAKKEEKKSLFPRNQEWWLNPPPSLCSGSSSGIPLIPDDSERRDQHSHSSTPASWPLPLRPARVLLFFFFLVFSSYFGSQTLTLFSFGRKLKNCRCIEPAARRRLSGKPPSACKKGKWGFLERSYLSSPRCCFFKKLFLFTSSVFWGFRRISFLSLGFFCVCVFPVKALPPLLLLLLHRPPPAVCHIPQSSQLCALFLEEHSGNLARQCAGLASFSPLEWGRQPNTRHVLSWCV